LWLTEAPVGIEPTNGGFAVLRELLRGSAFLPNRRPARAFTIPAQAMMFRLFAFLCGRTFPRPSHVSSIILRLQGVGRAGADLDTRSFGGQVIATSRDTASRIRSASRRGG
jgi:hypothetical protein